VGYGGKTAAGTSTDYNEVPPAPPMPLVDENRPGLGRGGGYIQEERRQSGGLEDESPEEPVRNDAPFKPGR
jgi:hypothetical protein